MLTHDRRVKFAKILLTSYVNAPLGRLAYREGEVLNFGLSRTSGNLVKNKAKNCNILPTNLSCFHLYY